MEKRSAALGGDPSGEIAKTERTGGRGEDGGCGARLWWEGRCGKKARRCGAWRCAGCAVQYGTVRCM